MKISVEIKKTKDLLKEEINSLIELKQQHWPYDAGRQISWLHTNIREDDYHVLIFRGGGLLAYLNIVNVDVEIDKMHHGMFGIGNVCVNKNHGQRGWGNILMAVTNAFIKERNTCAVLLCREKLVDFYKMSSWSELQAEKILVCGQEYHDRVMMYGSLKSIRPVQIRLISLNRNF
ncbi:MAG: GNAT family N-acetyltransferase [Lachnospiraceae bacterium]|nr:GNAT family N-acetyltransferase [Lachnospiraceae bacterium]